MRFTQCGGIDAKSVNMSGIHMYTSRLIVKHVGLADGRPGSASYVVHLENLVRCITSENGDT